uniref:Uncharacterized protein n=1 Tax=Marseillevirus LCMAC202 TaxID=2506606 RepID=A0A481Z0F2_9VIRU|nr:MAG: hypothetical protein LCMAC202_06260 [Marseillevirus LCMAC202]
MAPPKLIPEASLTQKAAIEMATEYIGYWAHDKWESEYPFPKPEKKGFSGLDRFLIRLAHIENNIAECEEHRRQSICRLCNKDNGSREYVLDMSSKIIRWPEGYSHYLAEHNIHPATEFYHLINRLYSKQTKPDYDRSGRKKNKNNWKQERAHKYCT